MQLHTLYEVTAYTGVPYRAPGKSAGVASCSKAKNIQLSAKVRNGANTACSLADRPSTNELKRRYHQNTVGSDMLASFPGHSQGHTSGRGSAANHVSARRRKVAKTVQRQQHG